MPELPPIPPAALRAALETAGFTLEQDGPETAVWRWPVGSRTLAVPAVEGPHYPDKLATVQEVLAEAAQRGRVADEVLDTVAGWRPVPPAGESADRPDRPGRIGE